MPCNRSSHPPPPPPSPLLQRIAAAAPSLALDKHLSQGKHPPDPSVSSNASDACRAYTEALEDGRTLVATLRRLSGTCSAVRLQEPIDSLALHMGMTVLVSAMEKELELFQVASTMILTLTTAPSRLIDLHTILALRPFVHDDLIASFKKEATEMARLLATWIAVGEARAEMDGG